jgi:acylphosphatase
MSKAERLEAIVRGRVQGVGFRHFTIRRAQELNLVGYVRNRWDLSVEVVAEGRREQLEALLEHLRRGPRAADVAGVEAAWLPATGEFSEFEARF